jgi:putative transposase
VTPTAEPPRPDTTRNWLDRPVVARYQRPRHQQPPTDLPADTRVRKVNSAGVIYLDKVFYKLDVDHAFIQVLVITDGDHFTVTDLDGEALAELTRAAPGTRYVGNGRAPGTRPSSPGLSPMS